MTLLMPAGASLGAGVVAAAATFSNAARMEAEYCMVTIVDD